MLAIQIIRGKGLPVKDEYFTTVNFCGEEIFRTEGCNRESNGDPVWQDADEFRLDEFNGKEEENKRPLFLEKISIQVYAERGDRKAEFVGEARIPLFNIGPPQWNKLVSKSEGVSLDAQILTALSFPQSKLQEFSNISFLPLCEILDPKCLQNSPLYMNFGDSSLDLFGANPLPGPTCGEILLDYHGNVEVEMSTGVNLFKDKCTVKCEGSLFLTDLRLIFMPSALTSTPPGFLSVPYVAHGSSCESEENLLAIRRMTIQIPISGIQDIKCLSSNKDETVASLRVVCRNSVTSDFTIRSTPGLQNNDEFVLEKKLGRQFYTGGLLSRNMLPALWCNRIAEEMRWMIREDFCWVRWADYLGQTMSSVFPAAPHLGNSNDESSGFVFREFAGQASVPDSRKGRRSQLNRLTCQSESRFVNKFHPCVNRFTDVPSPLKDYHRMQLNAEASWKISELNNEHKLCSTYPDVLVFPSSLSDDDIKEASHSRSKERLPSLVWIHPLTRTPLCRCAQPLAGISGVYVNEPDVKMCVAIREASSNKSKQLRILDCRPKINAQANAIQGKGFENIASLGGAEGATLVFADIHNINVMRESLQKVRESNGNNDADEGQGGGNSTAISKWLHHVGAVLRGAAASAESLLLEYPVLVHCSDGWDRTAQISALSQVLLDPYYRTINGFLMLIEKEWVGFGYQFEERSGRMTDKGTSPVFTQFLDCVWQLLNQFPTEFEFSSGFLEVLIMCSYSGFFSSFRHNCERHRVDELCRHMESTLNSSISIAHFSSVFTYIHMLLASNIAALLVNSKYVPATREVQYLHPRFGVEDLTLWTQGLLPRSFSSFSQGGGRAVLSRVECEALSSSSHTNLLNQWVSLMKYSSIGLISSIDVVNGRIHGPLLKIQTPHESTLKSERKGCNKPIDTSVYRQVDEDNFYSCAVIRVQVWFRALLALQKTLTVHSGNMTLRTHTLAKYLVISYYRSRVKERFAAYAIRRRIILSIIHDVVDFVVTSCDEMQRTCPDLIVYEAGTTRGTLHATLKGDAEDDFGSDDELQFRTKSKSTDENKSTKSKSGKSSLTTNFFSKISKGFNTSKKENRL